MMVAMVRTFFSVQNISNVLNEQKNFQMKCVWEPESYVFVCYCRNVNDQIVNRREETIAIVIERRQTDNCQL